MGLGTIDFLREMRGRSTIQGVESHRNQRPARLIVYAKLGLPPDRSAANGIKFGRANAELFSTFPVSTLG
jgi:hypothetical protein